jgi:hypothetical protein
VNGEVRIREIRCEHDDCLSAATFVVYLGHENCGLYCSLHAHKRAAELRGLGQ